jgi:hypothetical protein
MKTHLRLIALTLSLMLGGFVDADPAAPALVPASLAPGSRWIARPADNICGISDPRKVSNPAQLDYEDVFASTPSMRELKREGIDPDSVRGQILRREATELVCKTSELVRQSEGHCSVWKVIRNEDGRIVPDISDKVKAHF